MSALPVIKDMLKQVAIALQEDLREEMTFVGGCVVGLLITDELVKEGVRATEDVDLIINAITWIETEKLKEVLRARGFKDPRPDDDMPICSMRLGILRVDFMPIGGDALGFGSQWYEPAMKTASRYELEPALSINLVDPVYFLATKLEAYLGRGQGDASGSRDIEDVVNLVDGREELVQEVKSSGYGLRQYISKQVDALLQDDRFKFVIESQGYSSGGEGRADIIHDRFEEIVRSS